MFDVIMAGCGPTGAVLAAELRLHDVRVLVLEKETGPASFVRIVGLHIRSLELMAMRGLLDRIVEHGRRRPAAGFFAAIAKPPPEGLASSYAYLLGLPQPVIERLLDEHAIDLGAQVRHGRDLHASSPGGEGVTGELGGGGGRRSAGKARGPGVLVARGGLGGTRAARGPQDGGPRGIAGTHVAVESQAAGA